MVFLMDENQQQPIEESESLEAPDVSPNVVSTGSATPEKTDTDTVQDVLATPDDPLGSAANAPSEKPKNPLHKLLDRVNIYVVLLVLIVLLITGITYYAVKQNNQSDKNAVLNTQDLSLEDLKKLSNGDAQIGDPTQTLSIE